MPVSNFPNGFSSGVSVRGVPLLNMYAGKSNVFWVDSTAGSNGNPGTHNQPFSTIDYAVGRCTASNGDLIMVAPGHVETVIAGAGLALDVVGITVIGMGSGSNQPKVNYTTAIGATMTVSAANVTVVNMLFTGGFDALTSPIVVSAADFKLIDCEYRDVTGQCTDFLLTTAAADRMLIQNFRYDGAAAAGTNAGIAIVGGDRITIDGMWMDGNFAIGGIDVRTTATTDLEVRNVVFRTRHAADIFLVDTITTSTGMIGPNLYLRLQDNAANITEACTGATFVYMQPISVVNLAGESSMFTNITASTDA